MQGCIVNPAQKRHETAALQKLPPHVQVTLVWRGLTARAKTPRKNVIASCGDGSILTVPVYMKISKRGEYALRALIDIGIANELGRPLVQIGELAKNECLPIKFLEQILTQLKDGGFIESKRGKLGGYFLLMPARKIKIGQVIRLIDGPLAPVSCVSVIAYERCSCPDEEHCGLRMLMNDVRSAISNILDRFTLADTVEMTLKKVNKNGVEIPFIESLLAKPSVHDEEPEAPVAKKAIPKAAPAKKPTAKPVAKKPAAKKVAPAIVSKRAKPTKAAQSAPKSPRAKR